MKKYVVLKNFWHNNGLHQEGSIKEFDDSMAKAIGTKRLEEWTKDYVPKKRRGENEPTDLKIRGKNKVKDLKVDTKPESELKADDEEDNENSELSEKQAENYDDKMIDRNSPKAKRK